MNSPMENQTKTKPREVIRLYKPHRAQFRFHTDKSRFRVVSWGRQTGKSTGCLNELLAKAWENPGTRYWFIMPTFDQAKGMYRRTVGMLWNCRGVLLKKNQTELRIKLINQSEIVFKSGEVFDNLRSETLHGVIIDEVRDQRPELWNMVIRPMLATTQGWAAFVSTPRGYDHFYDLAESAKVDKSGEWSFMHMPATESPLWPASEIESIKRSMSEAEFAQEVMAEFRDITSGKAYYAHGTHNQRLTTPFMTSDIEQRVSERLPVVLGCDFNLSPMSWALGQTDRMKWHWFDEIYLEDSNTQEASHALIQKLLALRDRNLLKAKPQVIICGDATAKAGQRAAAGSSDYDILLGQLKRFGITYDNLTPDSNPLVVDRVNNVNAKLESADKQVSLTYDPVKCPHIKRDFERVVWKAQGTLNQTTDPTLTHMSDAIGYPVSEMTPIKSIEDVGTLKVIHR